LQQTRVQAVEILSGTEGEVDGPFALKGRPVVTSRIHLEDLVMDRVQRRRDVVQQCRPRNPELLIHELLRLRPVVDPGKAVVLARVGDASLDHLAGEPLPAVHTNLNRKREPRLNARVQETENGMNNVVIQEHALADTGLEVFGLPVAVDLKGAARFDAG
jgi:hypothetical protein